MAAGWDALYLSLLYVGWPGLGIVSAYSIWRAVGFYRRLRHSAPGLLVLLTIVGWVTTLAGAAFVMTLYLARFPDRAGPGVLPIFVLWAGSLITIAWVVYRWGEESQILDAYYGDIERMERMKSGFINHVAHELNTPMTPLKTQVTVLQRGLLGPLNEKQMAAMERMARNLDRLGALVQQVLMANSLQSGRLRIEPAPRNVDAILAEVAAAVGGVHTPTKQAVEADVDAPRLGYAIQMLADHLTRQGGSPVKLAVTDEGTSIIITIAHASTVLSPKDFEMFGDPALAAQQDGLAIGLFIANGIIEQHGGKFDMAPGRVAIRLPARHAVSRAA